MMHKKNTPIMLQQYLILSIDARLRSRNSTVSVKAETAECLVDRVMLIWKNRDFLCTFWIIQVYFSESDRFLC